MVKAEFIGISSFGSPLRRSLRGLRLRTEMTLRGIPVFRSAYSASRNARASAASRPSVGGGAAVIDHAMRVVRPAENVVQRHVKVVGVFQKNLRGGRGIVDLVPGKDGLGNVKFLCQLRLREPDAFAQAPEPFADDFQGCVASFSVSGIPGNRECINDIFT